MSAANALNHTLIFTAGFLVRPCCVIPAALAVAGASGAGVAAQVAPYRPWFLLVAALFFAVSFYWNFIRNHNKAGMAVWGVSVSMATVLLLGPALQASSTPSNPTDKEITMADDQTTQAQIPVEGMACQACARRLEKALAGMPGVTGVRVDFGSRQAEVGYDPDQLDVPAVEEGIRKAGFKPARVRQDK